MIIFTFLFFLQFNVYSKEAILDKFDHKFPGCPLNSECKIPEGQLRLKWLNAFKKLQKDNDYLWINNHIKTYGVPASAWVKNPINTIFWDSPCSYNKNKGVYDGLVFVVNTKMGRPKIHNRGITKETIQGDSLFLIPLEIFDEKTNKMYTYLTPKGEHPSYINNEDLFFIREEEQKFYGLKISKNGDWKLLDPSKMIKDTNLLKQEEIECPYKLKNSLTKSDKTKYFFFLQGFHCKTIWNSKYKRNFIQKIYWSCPDQI